MRLKSIIAEMYRTNADRSRPLLESVVVPEVTAALKDWIGSANVPGVLIGGLALSYYGKPRATMDVDIIYATDEQIPDHIPGFKHIRSHAFQHNKTHVEVEVLSPTHLGIPEGLVKKIIETAETSNGIKIASPSGLIALKLQRGDRRDQADIEQLLKADHNINIKPFLPWLTKQQQQVLNSIKKDVDKSGMDT